MARKGKQATGGKGKPPKQKRAGFSDKKRRRGTQKPRDTHDKLLDGPAKKCRKSWVPATLQEQKVARVIEQFKSGEERHGRSKSKFEVIMLLMVVLMLYVFHCDGTLAQLASEERPAMSRFYNLAAEMTGVGRNLARDAWTMMWKDSTSEKELLIRVADDVKRGRGSPEFPLQDARLLKPEHHDAIENFIAQCHTKDGGRVTLATVQRHLADNFKSLDDPKEPFTVSQGALRYCLVFQLGYHYGRVRLKKKGPGDARPAQVRSYLKKLDEALQLERENKAVLVYFDEVSVTVGRQGYANFFMIDCVHLSHLCYSHLLYWSRARSHRAISIKITHQVRAG